MITKFKIFENINETEPEVGDYVLCDETYDNYYVSKYGFSYLGFLKYIKTHVGIIDHIADSVNYLCKFYYVRYDNLPKKYHRYQDYQNESLLLEVGKKNQDFL